MADDSTKTMPYIPTVWQNEEAGGTPLDADHLNNMESGISRVQPRIGDMYITRSNVNPAAIFGGTWELLDNVHFFIGANTFVRVQSEEA